jgi:hypothetical protein
MDLSAFQLFKNNSRTNANNYLHDTPIISFGRIIKVIDIQTVIAETVIQTSLSREVYTVTLLNLSSVLMETNIYPILGDTVLLFFLQRHDLRMFVEKTVHNPDAVGYNRFSGVGVLMSSVKNMSKTILSFYDNNGVPVVKLNTEAEMYAAFNNSAAITFCRAVMDSDDEQLITLVFGQGRPFIQRFLSRVEKKHGFWYDGNNELVELDASVKEEYSIHAPITKDIQGAQTTDIGLGKDKDDKPIETDAPITEMVHGKAPIKRDIRSPQNITVGIGNDESGNAAEQRDANINIELGEKADIHFTSKSGITAEVERDVDEILHSNRTIGIDGDDSLDVGGNNTKNIKGNVSWTVGINSSETIAGIKVIKAAVINLN